MLKLISGLLMILAISAQGRDLISFTSLGEGETIRVTFVSSGCFHHSKEIFEFHDFTADVTSIDQKWSVDKEAYEETGTRKLGTTRLSSSDLSRLDALLRFYRTPSPGGCTTVDKIKLELLRGGKVVTTEDYVDSTCATYEMKDLLTFQEIARQLKEKK